MRDAASTARPGCRIYPGCILNGEKPESEDAQRDQCQWGRSGKFWLDTMAAITIAVATHPLIHEYHRMQSFVSSARLCILDNVETDARVTAPLPIVRQAGVLNTVLMAHLDQKSAGRC